jgi:hypothetical protein
VLQQQRQQQCNGRCQDAMRQIRSGQRDAQHSEPRATAAAAAATVDAGVLAAFRRLQGPVVTFNLLRPDGSWVGHREVAKLALIHGICIRTGKITLPVVIIVILLMS